MYAAEQRHARHRQADLIEAIAMGYSGCRSKDPRAIGKMVAALRK